MAASFISIFGKFLPLKYALKKQKHDGDVDVDVDDDDNGSLTILPDNVILIIISYLNPIEFVRFRCTSKSMNKICQRITIESTTTVSRRDSGLEPPLPWLLLPNHHLNNDSTTSLSFYDIFEGTIHDIKLPEKVRGGWCCASCRGGWVPVTKPVNILKLQFVPEVFLFNPITGQTLQLPSLDTIPGYDWHVDGCPDNWNVNASWLITKLDFSGSSPTDPGSIIAGIFFNHLTIAFCKIGDESWTTGDIEIDEDIGYYDILFSADATTLYAIYKSDNDSRDCPAIQTKNLSLTFFEHDLRYNSSVNITFTSIIPEFLDKIDDKLGPLRIRELSHNLSLVENDDYDPYLLETSQGKLSILFKATKCLITENNLDHDDADFDDDVVDARQPDLHPWEYESVNGFKVLNIDLNTGEVDEDEKKEGNNDIIFVGLGCFSISSKDFSKGCVTPITNSIYFIDDFFFTRETGIFDMNSGRITRCFPAVYSRHPIHTKMLWFTPSF